MQMDQLNRRAFIGVVGSAAAWPLAADAQQPSKLRRIGLLATGTVSSHGPWFAELVRRLHELGWIENRNIVFEYRWGEGRTERYDEIAAELVQRQPRRITGGYAQGVQQALSARSGGGLAAAWARGVQASSARVAGLVFESLRVASGSRDEGRAQRRRQGDDRRADRGGH